MSPRLVVLIALLAATGGFGAGWLSRPRAAAPGPSSASTRHDRPATALGGSSGDESPRRATRTFRPRRGKPRTPAASTHMRGAELSSEVEHLFTKGLGDEWMDSLAWSAIQGALVDADADDALHTIDQVHELLAADGRSFDVGEIAGILIMHTAWMRLGQLQGQEAFAALASEERWTDEHNDDDSGAMFTAIVTGWARSDQAAAREWFEETLSTAPPDIHPNLREAFEDAELDDIRRSLGLPAEDDG